MGAIISSIVSAVSKFLAVLVGEVANFLNLSELEYSRRNEQHEEKQKGLTRTNTILLALIVVAIVVLIIKIKK